jgi:DnaJ-class molecular chaperone
VITTSVAVIVAALGPTPTPGARPTPHPSTAAGPTSPGDMVANADAGLILFVILAAVVISYVVSIKVNPNRKCRKCKGKGFHRGTVFTYATRGCTTCGNRGVVPRFGVKFLSGNH